MKYYQVSIKPIELTEDGGINLRRPKVIKALYNKRAYMQIINGELFTPREYEQLQLYYNFDPSDFTVIHWKKKATGFIFGARFQLQGGEQ